MVDLAAGEEATGAASPGTRRRKKQRRAYWRCPECGRLVAREQWACSCGTEKSERARFAYGNGEPAWRDTWLGVLVAVAIVGLAVSSLRGCLG